MGVLLRTSLETVVNACYLADASDGEVVCYWHFPLIAAANALKDIEVATGLGSMPPDLVTRTRENAAAAATESGLVVGKHRYWSLETRTNIMLRAKKVDESIGGKLFTVQVASMYAITSSYTHADHSTLTKHWKKLLTGETENPRDLKYGVNGKFQGILNVLILFCHYVARRVGADEERIDAIAAESVNIMNIATTDFKSDRSESDPEGER